MKSIGQEAAIALHQTKWWRGKTHAEIVEKQARYEELICPYAIYFFALWEVLGRAPVSREIQYPHLCQSVTQRVKLAKWRGQKKKKRERVE